MSMARGLLGSESYAACSVCQPGRFVNGATRAPRVRGRPVGSRLLGEGVIID